METVNNKTFTFKTTINCDGCIAKVTPFMNGLQGIGKWSVDTADKNKILTVVSTGVSEGEIIETVQKAGFKIEAVN